MTSLTRKKVSISIEQNEFLENYKKWGFSDQSSIVREALSQFITEVKTKQRKSQMAEKAKELLPDYSRDEELTPFTEIDLNWEPETDLFIYNTFHSTSA